MSLTGSSASTFLDKFFQKVTEMQIKAAPTTAVAVANVFLDFAREDQRSIPAMDLLKLQQLVFYAHAWWLALRDAPLFDEDVGAWPWGPSVRSVLLAFKEAGSDLIGDARGRSLIVEQESGQVELSIPPKPSSDVVEFLVQIWEVHNRYSGATLCNSTHGPGEPWRIVEEKLGHLEFVPRIPNELIRQIFERKL